MVHRSAFFGHPFHPAYISPVYYKKFSSGKAAEISFGAGNKIALLPSSDVRKMVKEAKITKAYV
ncbi:hypothetical protein HMPREF1986_00174 [Oribacterium sp. oral taxon 078 str. F0263]|nr:hypothetical protein HMPREF1986_00174 [Oribacterium sp. oral taxon 078 str. F0263]